MWINWNTLGRFLWQEKGSAIFFSKNLKILFVFYLVYTTPGADKPTEPDRMGRNFEDCCK
jgi:hypothetical protein